MAGITTKKGSPLKKFIIDIASPSTKDQNQKRIKTKKGSIKKLLPPKNDHYLQRIIINKGSSKKKIPINKGSSSKKDHNENRITINIINKGSPSTKDHH